MNTLSELRDHAIASHAQYPQYVGYFDSWTLGELTRRVRTKGGTDLAAGTLVLTNFDHEDIPGVPGPVVSFYDPTTTHVVVIEAAKVATVETLTRHPEGLVWFAS